MAPTRIILQLIGITVLASSAMGLKCYHCESTNEPECADIKKSSNIQPKLCTTALLATDSGHWMRSLIKLTIFANQAPTTDNMVCQTIVGKKDGNETTIRTCQYDPAQTDLCVVAKTQLHEKRYPDTEIISCSVCKEDSCNSGLRMSGVSFGSLVLVVGFVCVLNWIKGN